MEIATFFNGTGRFGVRHGIYKLLVALRIILTISNKIINYLTNIHFEQKQIIIQFLEFLGTRRRGVLLFNDFFSRFEFRNFRVCLKKGKS